ILAIKMPGRTWGHPGSVDHVRMELSLRRSAASSGNAAKQGVRPSIHVSDGHPTVDGSSESLPSIDRESPLLMIHRAPYFMRVATTLQNSSDKPKDWLRQKGEKYRGLALYSGRTFKSTALLVSSFFMTPPPPTGSRRPRGQAPARPPTSGEAVRRG